MRTYANALPLSVIGGPNEGVGNFADGRETDPPFETHKSDLSVPEGYVSRLEKWRHITCAKGVRVFAAVAFTLGGAVACAGQNSGGGNGVVATAEASPDTSRNTAESATPECYDAFHALDATNQENCRELIAGMELSDVNTLHGLDEARWANYYRHAALGERGVLQNVVRTSIIDDPSGAESAALQFLTHYQGSVYRLAWLMQNKPAAAKDPRTLRALLGSDATDSEAYKIAAYIAHNSSPEGGDVNEYIRTSSSAGSIFTSLFAENIRVKPEGEQRLFSFTAESQTVSGAPRKLTFTYRMYPYMEAHKSDDGLSREKPDNPNDPSAALFAQLGTPLLAGPVQISDATS